MTKKGETVKTQIALVAKDVSNIKTDVREIKDTLKADYITRTEFKPVRDLVYGMVGLILVAFVGAIVALVIK